jgi:hypothetical protein
VDDVDEQPSKGRRWIVFWIVLAVVLLLGGVCFALPAIMN